MNPDARHRPADDRTRRRSLDITSLVATHVADGLCMMDAEGRLTYMNPAAERILGWTQAELAGEILHERVHYLHPDGSPFPMDQCPLALTLSNGVVVRNPDDVWIRKNGEPFPVSSSCSPIRRDGQIIGAVLSLRDMTQSRRAEERQAFLAQTTAVLSSSLDEVQTVQELARLCVPFVADYCLVHCVASGQELRQLASAHRDPELAPLLQRAAGLQRIDLHSATAVVGRVVRTGKAVLVPEVSTAMVEQFSRDPETVAALRRLGPRSLLSVPLTARGQTIGALSLVMAESGRRYGDEDLALALELASRAALSVDNARLYQEARTRVEHLSRLHELAAALSGSLTAEEVAGVMVQAGRNAFGAEGAFFALMDESMTGMRCLRSSGYSDGFGARWRDLPLSVPLPATEVVRSGRSLFLGSRAERDARFPQMPGPRGYEAVAAAPLVVEERILGSWVLHFREPRSFDSADREFFLTLTHQCAHALERARLYAAERRARVEAEEANRAKADFLAVMSHELRTPLTAIMAFAELLEMGIPEPLPQPALFHVSRIDHAARHLLRLIEEILSFSRIEAAKEEIRCSWTDLGEIAHEAVEFVRPLAHKKGLPVELVIPAGQVGMETDGGKVRQVLVNLLFNAVKFTPSGSVRLEVEAVGDSVRLHVRDTGIGMPEGVMAKVFEPFWQAQNPATREVGGTGLGLSISQRLAKLLGGWISVESEVGVGTTFTLHLPLTSGSLVPVG